jgi:hypothetical protein
MLAPANGPRCGNEHFRMDYASREPLVRHRLLAKRLKWIGPTLAYRALEIQSRRGGSFSEPMDMSGAGRFTGQGLRSPPAERAQEAISAQNVAVSNERRSPRFQLAPEQDFVNAYRGLVHMMTGSQSLA